MKYIQNSIPDIIIASISIIIGTYILNFILRKIINTLFQKVVRIGANREVIVAKTNTVRSLLKSFITALLFCVAFLMILAQFNVNIMPFLTGAGIFGLAISFGAQSLVKDIISGVFIMIENQFNIGDEIQVGNHEGKVIKISLRITILKEKNGNIIYVPNSQFLIVVKKAKTSLIK